MKPLLAAAFVGLPLFMVGCGGGGSSNSIVTPAPTTSSRINARFSQPTGDVTLPATAIYAAAESFLSSNLGDGEYSLEPSFGVTQTDPVSVKFGLNKVGRIESGDTFDFTFLRNEPGHSSMAVYYNTTDSAGRFLKEGLRAQSGTLKVDSLVYRPSSDPAKRTVDLKFTVTNAMLRNEGGSRGITFNGSGEITLRNFSNTG